MYRTFFSTGLRRILPILGALVFFGGCEELDLVLKHRTPTYIAGTPRILETVVPVTNGSAGLLSSEGWRPVRLFEELPETSAVQTGQGDHLQLLLRDRGILEIRPESLVLIGGITMKEIRVIQGKAVFITIPERFRARYRNAATPEEKTRVIRSFRDSFLSRQEGMYHVRNPFRFSTVFSSSVARKGKSFSVVVDTNHDLEQSRFRLAGLKPAFHKINTKKKPGETYRYMAVTGLDIHEQVQNIEYTAEAKDLTGNWVKVASTIPTENYRFRLMRGRTLRPVGTVPADRDRYAKRYHKELAARLKTPAARKRHRAVLYRRNRRLGFYWKWRTIFSQGRAIRRAHAYFTKLFSAVNSKKYWQGRFRLPVGGVVTSEYGHYRYYYGGHASRHKAVDIAAPVGTRIAAPNNGKVVYAGYNPTRGANIVIDHGLGVYSCYFHLSEIFVRAGDMVRTGDFIATMGNSGLSSGPHLHWEMWVNGRKVNPLDWVNNAY